jgi:hypothetical protein
MKHCSIAPLRRESLHLPSQDALVGQEEDDSSEHVELHLLPEEERDSRSVDGDSPRRPLELSPGASRERNLL